MGHAAGALGASPVKPLRVATLSLPLDGQVDCGDIVASLPPLDAQAAHWLAVIDGLGHGAPAALAARRALAVVQAEAAPPGACSDPLALLRRLDAALVGSRGAAIGLACVQAGRLRHAGVGNTRALRWRAGRVLRLPSRYGIVGDGRLAQLSELAADAEPAAQEIDLLPGDCVLLFTDGLAEALHLELMLPEWQTEPQRLCQHLMARWRQIRDDAAVLVCQVPA